MTFLDANRVRLEYESIPAPAGAPADASCIVFLHEGLGSIGQWRDFPQRLAAASGCSALIYARQGHGRSSPLTARREPQFMHTEAREVLPRVLQQLGITRPILFGHSDGASIALLYAGIADGPNPPRGLIVEAPHIFVEQRSIDGIEAARRAYLDADLKPKLARYHADVDGVFFGWNDIWLAPDFRSWNIEDCLPAIACPVLAIQGYDDAYGSMAQIDAIAAKVPAEVSLLKLAACGHAPHRDQSEKTLAASLRFIRELAR
jgi:pimeloyl-ACP methyl ester carboxylesterase